MLSDFVLNRHVPASVQEKQIYTFVNPTNYYFVKSKIYSFDSVFSDGFFLTNLYNRRYGKTISRASFDFSSIAGEVFEACEKYAHKIAFVGAKPSEIHQAVSTIRKKHPMLDVVYVSDGYRSHAEIINELVKVDFNILIVSTGSPNQECFLMEAISRIEHAFIGFTSGGFLTQTAMKPDYYPKIIREYGLRWVYRAIKHSHVRQKLLIQYPKFLFQWIKDTGVER